MKVYTVTSNTIFNGVFEGIPLGVFLTKVKARAVFNEELNVEKQEGPLLSIDGHLADWMLIGDLVANEDFFKVGDSEFMFEMRIDEQELAI